MKTYVTSRISESVYAAEDVVRILNYQQAIYYINNGLKLLDVYTSINHKTKQPLLVYIFNREDTRDVYDSWCSQGVKEAYDY